MHHLVRTIFDLSFQCATLTIRWYLALCSLLDGLFQRNIISLNNHQKSFFCDTNNPTIDAMKHLHDTFSIHLTIFQDSLYTYNEENIHVRRRRNDWSASSIHHTSSISNTSKHDIATWIQTCISNTSKSHDIATWIQTCSSNIVIQASRSRVVFTWMIVKLYIKDPSIYEQELHEFTFTFIKFSYRFTMTIQTSIGLKDMNPELSTKGSLSCSCEHGTGCKLVAYQWTRLNSCAH